MSGIQQLLMAMGLQQTCTVNVGNTGSYYGYSDFADIGGPGSPIGTIDPINAQVRRNGIAGAWSNLALNIGFRIQLVATTNPGQHYFRDLVIKNFLGQTLIFSTSGATYTYGSQRATWTWDNSFGQGWVGLTGTDQLLVTR